MLRFISIDNYTLIDHLEAEFRRGLNLITGETGSGKSILVDAVGLLVGGRASHELVRKGCEMARIEGVFDVSSDSAAQETLQCTGLQGDGEDLIIRREISLTGSNRVFINGRLSTLSQLVELGAHLVDIHGQHEQQGLLQASKHLDFIDAFGGNSDLLDSVGRLFRTLEKTQRRIQQIQDSERERLQRRDLIQYQIKEIEGLQLKPGIDKELEEERSLLGSAEKRSLTVRESYDLLYERESSVLAMLDRVSQGMANLAELDAGFSDSSKKVREIYYLLEEIAYSTRDYADRIEFNPARLEHVEERLAEIERAKRKYGGSLDEILSYAERIMQESDELESQETELEELLASQRDLESSYQDVAQVLSDKRKQDAVRLAEVVEIELADLAMRDTQFEVRVERLEGPIAEKGIDVAEFLISPNPGEPLRPLAKFASGGELSRVMLALKSVLKTDESPRTLVFDEIDAGIGGRVANSLGEKLHRLSRHHQVFCVTHLPQIAALARQHFHVGKHPKARRTIVELARLDHQGRVEELSRMLAGDAVTATTRMQAQEMLDAVRSSTEIDRSSC